jgi:hypothetical protein
LHDNQARVPKPGEQISFEPGDCANFPAAVTVRVTSMECGYFGEMTVVGERIGNLGQPTGASIRLIAAVATIEARMVHRR